MRFWDRNAAFAVWVPVLLLAACGSSEQTVKGIRILSIEEHEVSANGTWEHPCQTTDTGMEQLVLQFSGKDTLVSTQTYDAPATNCGGTPAKVANIIGTSAVQDEIKVVSWLDDTSPEGLPDSLLASQIILSLDKAIGKTTELNLIVVIDDEASPDALYMSRSDDGTVTLDKNGFPNELNATAFEN
jgi:hypothetical protein